MPDRIRLERGAPQVPFRDRYLVFEVLGLGGEGRVHRAIDREAGRDVAVKFLRRDALGRGPRVDAVLARWSQELSAVRAIGHPAIRGVLDVGTTEDGTPYVTLELLRGETLLETLRRRRNVPVGEAARVLRVVLDALVAAHARGILHRDIKPSNVFLDWTARPPHVRLCDFGLTAASSVRVGTLGYLAPELMTTGASVGPWTDVYACGVLLLDLVEGLRHRHGATARFPRVASRLPALGALEPVVGRALAPDPTRRPSAAELRDELAPFQAEPYASLRLPLSQPRGIPTLLEDSSGSDAS